MKTILTDTQKTDFLKIVTSKGLAFRDAAYIIGLSASYIASCFQRNSISSNALYLLNRFQLFIDMTPISLYKLPLESREAFFKRKAACLKNLKTKFQKYIEQLN